MPTEKLEDLRQIVADEQTNMTTRQLASERYIDELANAVSQPTDDDPEVQERMKPWKDQDLASLMRGTSGSSQFGNGESSPAAKKEVHQRRRLQSVLAVVVDEDAHLLERMAACERVLADHPQIAKWRLNHFTPKRLLETVLPQGATKWTSAGRFPIECPPLDIQDVWTL